jgi:hypothetical protein
MKTRSARQRRQAASTKPPGPPQEPVAKPTLRRGLKPGQEPESGLAGLVVDGLCANAFATTRFAAGLFGEVDLTACLDRLEASVERVNGGRLADLEGLLTAQAVTLNAMFAELVLIGKNNIGCVPEARALHATRPQGAGAEPGDDRDGISNAISVDASEQACAPRWTSGAPIGYRPVAILRR